MSEIHQQLLERSTLTAAAEMKLHRILASPEFHSAVRTPSLWDRWKQEFVAWLARQFDQILRAAAQHPTTSQIVFWTLASLAVVFVAYQLYRLWRNASPTEPQNPSGSEAREDRSPVDWWAAAQEAASGRDFNRAIQCAYWSGVLCLQDSRALPNDAATTPRERLLVLERGDAISPLQLLTRALERFWYGKARATGDDWAECLRALDQIGCKRD